MLSSGGIVDLGTVSVQLQPCGPPKEPAGSQASHYTTAKGKPCRAFGLASSGNGLYVAVARETPYAKQLNLT